MLGSKFSLKESLLIYTIIGLVCVAVSLALVIVYQIGHRVSATSPLVIAVPVGDIIPPENVTLVPAKVLSAGLPLRLLIPKITLDTPIEYVGLTPIGAMDTPKVAAEVGWFELGPRPGDVGSAVIAGHYDVKGNKPGAFGNLHLLSPGDKILVQDNKGRLISFRVREIKLFNPKADATTVFSSTDGKAHLNLITCEGIWNSVAKGYPKRLVVFADEE